MQIVNQHLKYSLAPLMEPNTKGYIHAAFEVDTPRIPPYLFTSRRKKKILARAKAFAETLRARPEVSDASVFRAALRPPVRQPYLEKVRHKLHVARYDVVLLIETNSPAAAAALRAEKSFAEFLDSVRGLHDFQHVVVAENARRIGEVDRTRPGVFLFNYFYSESPNDVLPVWEYTAGWFTNETRLDNSTLLLPQKNETSEYHVINHCRWDSLARLLPHIILKKSMDAYVVANFEANDIAVMPILYRLA